MTRYITLSKAARLVGVKRATLQKQIRQGELSTFEGMLDVSELLRAYPETRMEDNTMIERVERFMEQAFAKAMRHEAEAMDLHTLARRVSLLSQELAAAKSEIHRYSELLEQIKQRVADLSEGETTGFKSWFLQALEGRAETEEYPEELLAKEAFLRIMAAHVRLLPSGHEFFAEGSANLLEAGLSAGIPLHYGCRDGSCGRCKARLISGELRATRDSRFDLTPAEREQGTVLLCCNTAVTDLVLEAPESGPGKAIRAQSITMAVRSVKRLGDAVTVVQVAVPRNERLEFLAGQYVRLRTADGTSGEFSLASCPCDDTKLEFHFLRGAAGLAEPSPFLALKPADPLTVEGPKGDFVLEADSDRAIITLAFDAGFAPIKGLIEHAIALDLVDAIELYWCDTGVTGHYLGNLCRSWSDALELFEYHPMDAERGASAVEALTDSLLAVHSDLSGYDIYAAGEPDQLEALHTALLAAGAEPQLVHLEPVRQGEPPGQTP